MVDASVWGRRPDASLCRDLSILGEATGMGQWSTPSRLGDALQRREWVGERGWRGETMSRLQLEEHAALIVPDVLATFGGRRPVHAVSVRPTDPTR